MLTPSIREDIQLFEGTPLEDGSPTWLIFDTLTNKYFTIGLNAFRLLNYWNADVDTKTFIKNVEQKGVNLKEEELNDFISFLKDCFICLLYTSPSPRDVEESRMPSSA